MTVTIILIIYVSFKHFVDLQIREIKSSSSVTLRVSEKIPVYAWELWSKLPFHMISTDNSVSLHYLFVQQLLECLSGDIVLGTELHWLAGPKRTLLSLKFSL